MMGIVRTMAIKPFRRIPSFIKTERREIVFWAGVVVGGFVFWVRVAIPSAPCFQHWNKAVREIAFFLLRATPQRRKFVARTWAGRAHHCANPASRPQAIRRSQWCAIVDRLRVPGRLRQQSGRPFRRLRLLRHDKTRKTWHTLLRHVAHRQADLVCTPEG